MRYERVYIRIWHFFWLTAGAIPRFKLKSGVRRYHLDVHGMGGLDFDPAYVLSVDTGPGRTIWLDTGVYRRQSLLRNHGVWESYRRDWDRGMGLLRCL